MRSCHYIQSRNDSESYSGDDDDDDDDDDDNDDDSNDGKDDDDDDDDDDDYDDCTDDCTILTMKKKSALDICENKCYRPFRGAA